MNNLRNKEIINYKRIIDSMSADKQVAQMSEPGMSWKEAVCVMENLVAEHNSVIEHFPHPEVDKVSEAWARIQRG